MRREAIKEWFPELNKIKDKVLVEKCVDTWLAAINEVGHTEESVQKVLFAGAKLKGCTIGLIEHTQQVVRTSIMLAESFNKAYSPQIIADMDIIIASAVLHDVGKCYEHPPLDMPDVTEKTRYMRHPLSGALFAERYGCPWKVVYIIANHSFEGDKSLDMPEFFLVKKADWLNFDYLHFGYSHV